MAKTAKIAVVEGDGIGPEIVAEAVRVLEKISVHYGHHFSFEKVCAGGCAINRYGHSLPAVELEKCLNSDAVLLGAVGGPEWDGCPKDIRPEAALLGLRKALGLFANLRPARLFLQLADASPLKESILRQGIDLLLVRELIGGVYFGEHKVYLDEAGQKTASDLMIYRAHEIERVAHTAFQAAQKRNGRVISVDKANVLDSSRLWREIVHQVAAEYPDVSCTDMLVDNAAMQLVKAPSQFDVLLTENMFGDILSDEASMITGSIGMIPSASLGVGKKGMYEPVHGSAPDIAGKNIANPIGTILSAAMLLRYSLDLPEEADAIEAAVSATLDEGFRTSDIADNGMDVISCSEMGEIIAKKIG